MVRRRQVAYTIITILIFGSQPIGNFASRLVLEKRESVAEQLSQTTSDNAAESANTFQRFLPEQHTEQLTPVVLEHKINEGGEQQEHQDDHGRMLSWKPPKKPPPRDPPENHTGYRPPPPI